MKAVERSSIMRINEHQESERVRHMEDGLEWLAKINGKGRSRDNGCSQLSHKISL